MPRTVCIHIRHPLANDETVFEDNSLTMRTVAVGMGRSIALRLAKDGFSVALNDLHSQKDALVDLQTQIRAEYSTIKATGQNCIVTVGDVTSSEDVERMVNEVVEGLGSLNIVSPSGRYCVKAFEMPTSFPCIDGSQRWNMSFLDDFHGQ